jgi:hypothetical protein
MLALFSSEESAFDTIKASTDSRGLSQNPSTMQISVAET